LGELNPWEEYHLSRLMKTPSARWGCRSGDQFL